MDLKQGKLLQNQLPATPKKLIVDYSQKGLPSEKNITRQLTRYDSASQEKTAKDGQQYETFKNVRAFVSQITPW